MSYSCTHLRNKNEKVKIDFPMKADIYRVFISSARGVRKRTENKFLIKLSGDDGIYEPKPFGKNFTYSKSNIVTYFWEGKLQERVRLLEIIPVGNTSLDICEIEVQGGKFYVC
ncbi:hypothetical protein ElyMa_004134900 [Elysia marginata]|uniref:Uncharacterized protein n=1 Tax=Elysia marginata TaxID=1093978 RepID=A0AAV4GDT8_9GAST|nr:hypothetical protein ElyMa_004134900 [Elysia marginata]